VKPQTNVVETWGSPHIASKQLRDWTIILSKLVSGYLSKVQGSLC